MASVYDTLSAWARKTTSFAELLVSGHERGPDSQPPQPGDRIYRLKFWPNLPPSLTNADVLRTLSVMSHRPVNRRWILASSRLKPRQVDRLLSQLEEQGAVDVVDSARFADSKA